MWPKHYRDTPQDGALKKERVETGKGIVGCEMHEINGWGESYHQVVRRRGFFSTLFIKLLRPKN